MFKNLNKILASNNEIIDRGVTNLENLDFLKILNLRHNQLKSFTYISKLPLLEELDIGVNLIND